MNSRQFLLPSSKPERQRSPFLSHAGIQTAILNVSFYERSFQNDRFLCFSPLNHVFAQSTLYTGGGLILLPAFDLDRVLHAVPDPGSPNFTPRPPFISAFCVWKTEAKTPPDPLLLLSRKHVSHAQTGWNLQSQWNKIRLTTKPAYAIQEVIVFVNGCFDMLGCSWSWYIIQHFRLIHTEKAAPYLWFQHEFYQPRKNSIKIWDTFPLKEHRISA